MSIHSPGDRVFAVRNADAVSVYLFGFGVFDGHQPCPFLAGTLNPHITLDAGKGEVWGMQCWWGSEANFTTFAAGRAVVDAPVVVNTPPPPAPPRDTTAVGSLPDTKEGEIL